MDSPCEKVIDGFHLRGNICEGNNCRWRSTIDCFKLCHLDGEMPSCVVRELSPMQEFDLMSVLEGRMAMVVGELRRAFGRARTVMEVGVERLEGMEVLERRAAKIRVAGEDGCDVDGS